MSEWNAIQSGDWSDEDTWQPAVTYQITAVSTVGKAFTIDDDTLAPMFNVPGAHLVIYGSTGNDGTYTIVNAGGPGSTTVITVTEVVPSAVADGNLYLGGVPAAGDDVFIAVNGGVTVTVDVETDEMQSVLVGIDSNDVTYGYTQSLVMGEAGVLNIGQALFAAPDVSDSGVYSIIQGLTVENFPTQQVDEHGVSGGGRIKLVDCTLATLNLTDNIDSAAFLEGSSIGTITCANGNKSITGDVDSTIELITDSDVVGLLTLNDLTTDSIFTMDTVAISAFDLVTTEASTFSVTACTSLQLVDTVLNNGITIVGDPSPCQVELQRTEINGDVTITNVQFNLADDGITINGNITYNGAGNQMQGILHLNGELQGDGNAFNLDVSYVHGGLSVGAGSNIGTLYLWGSGSIADDDGSGAVHLMSSSSTWGSAVPVDYRGPAGTNNIMAIGI